MKSSETKLLSVEDLKDKLVESMKQLSDLKLNHAVSPLENPMQIKNVRRTVARILTEIAAKQ
jgi:large subunit ribosomal protein L29|tara:strand:- start:114 stop:299 length:186 start_codon:yes stop_codon:yes gene_type:complete